MEYTPLFEPGMHDIAEAELDNHFLRSFSASQTRPALIAGLRVFIASLKRVGVAFEIWLDGSFCTEKTNPNDIDLVVFADANQLNALDSVQQQYVKGLLDRANSRTQFGCDVLFCPAGDFDMRSYWRGWYGFDRDENPKGIAKLVVAP